MSKKQKMCILLSTYSANCKKNSLQVKIMVWRPILEACGSKAVFGVFELSVYLPCCARGPLAMECSCYGETSFPTYLGASLTGLHPEPADSEESGRRTLVCRSIKNKRETQGAPSIPEGISCEQVLFPESVAVFFFFASPYVFLAFGI